MLPSGTVRTEGSPPPPAPSPTEKRGGGCIGIVVAVREELEAIRRRMSSVEMESVDGISFHRGALGGQAVVLAKSGMGAVRAKFLAARLIERFAPRALLIGGFCTGLAPEDAPGDILIAERVTDATLATARQPCPEPHNSLAPDPALLSLAQSITLPNISCRTSDLLTFSFVIQHTDEKDGIAKLHPGPLAVDMETGGVAAAAQAAGVPWLAVRAITDGRRDNLPLDFSRFVGEDGEVNRPRLVAAVLRRPWKIPALLRLGARASRAAGNLAIFVERCAEGMRE